MYLAEAPGSKRIRELANKYGVETSRFTGIDISAKGERCVIEADGNGMALTRKVPSNYGNDPKNWTIAAPSLGE